MDTKQLVQVATNLQTIFPQTRHGFCRWSAASANCKTHKLSQRCPLIILKIKKYQSSDKN